MAKDYYLTRRAARNFRDIYVYSLENWGEKVADKYMSALITAMQKAAENPELGKLRIHRTAPFLIVPAGQHFAIYKEVEDGIMVAAILHSRRNIEGIIRKLEPLLTSEINDLRKGLEHDDQ